MTMYVGWYSCGYGTFNYTTLAIVRSPTYLEAKQSDP